MKLLATFLLAIFVILGLFVVALDWIDPPQPVLLVDASAPAQGAGPMFLLLPPVMGRPVWCGSPQGKRPRNYIEET